MKHQRFWGWAVILTAGLILFYLLLDNKEEDNLNDVKTQHRQFVENSPFKETKKLSRSERKKRSLPPNAYNERMWELSMNPRLGIPTPYLVKPIATELIAKSAPGSTARAWEERGPNNVAGRTRVVFYDPNDVGANNGDGQDYNRVFAGGVGGGLWVNDNIEDASSPWNIIPGVAANLNVSAYAIDPQDPAIMYIGTGEQYAGGAAIGNGLYKTVDGGITWSQVTITPAGIGTVGTGFDLFTSGIFFINDIAIWNNNGNNEIFVGIGSTGYTTPNFNISNPNNTLGAQTAGLYRSTDDGSTWARVESPQLSYNFGGQTFYIPPNDFEISADNTLYMATISAQGIGQGGGRFYSTTDGANWNLQGVIPGADRLEIAASSQNPNLFYVAAQINGEGNLYVSNDALNTVTQINEPNDADNSIPPNDFTRGQAFYNLVIEVDPTNDQIIYAGGIDAFRSVNGGNSWSQISKWMNGNGLQTINAPFIHADIHALTFNPLNRNQALIGSDGGVSWAQSLSTAPVNAGAILTRNLNYNVTQFYQGSIGPDARADQLLGGAQDNGTQFVNGAAPGVNPFQDVLGGDGGHVEINAAGGYAIITSQFNNHRLYSYPSFFFQYCIATPNCSDGGFDADGDFINIAELDKNQNILYSNSRNFNGTNAIDACQLFSGASACTALSNNLISNNRPTAFKVSPFNQGNTDLYIGTQFSTLIKVENADTATPTWTSIGDGNFLGSVSDIEFGATEQEIYLTMHNYGVDNIWYTTDGGTTWASKDGNLPDIPVKAILPNPLLAGEVIIGTEIGIFATSDINAARPVWQPLINGMTNVKVLDLDLRTSDNTILATTHGRGMFTGQFDTLGIDSFDDSANEIIIYPTVSNGEIFLESDLNLADSQISVYNLAGQRVFETTKDLSSSATGLDLNVKSGFYLVTIASGSFSTTQKIVVK